MIILIMGPQGSGKGTQARRLAEEFGLLYLDVGALLRKISKTDERINEIVNKRGALLPDKEIFEIVTKHLSEKGQYDNLILDGYPRSIQQYELVENWLEKNGSRITKALFLNVSESESVKRLSARRFDPKTGKIYNLITKVPGPEVDVASLVHREDDKPEAIQERLTHYRETTKPLIEKLREEGKLVELDGERAIEEIHSDMKEEIRKIK